MPRLSPQSVTAGAGRRRRPPVADGERDGLRAEAPAEGGGGGGAAETRERAGGLCMLRAAAQRMLECAAASARPLGVYPFAQGRETGGPPSLCGSSGGRRLQETQRSGWRALPKARLLPGARALRPLRADCDKIDGREKADDLLGAFVTHGCFRARGRAEVACRLQAPLGPACSPLSSLDADHLSLQGLCWHARILARCVVARPLSTLAFFFTGLYQKPRACDADDSVPSSARRAASAAASLPPLPARVSAAARRLPPCLTCSASAASSSAC